MYQLSSQSLLDLTLEPSVTHAGFYEGFHESLIPKIVLVSRFLLFICISYLPKVLDLTLVSSMVLSRLPQTEHCNFMPDFVCRMCLQSFPVSPICNNDLLSVNRSSAESGCSTGFSVSCLDFEQINTFLNFRF